DQRVQRERLQLRLLARTMYAQPESAVLALFGSGSLADALTRVSDLTAAGNRAAATEHALESDLGSLEAQRVAVKADQQRAEQLRRQLDARFRALGRLIAASLARPPTARGPAASPPAAPQPPAAPKPPAPPPPAPGSIQQIILDAFAPLGAG